MNSGFLAKLLGGQKQWHGPCTVMLDADATIQASGSDAIVNAGIKNYAPRLITGRLCVDSICYLPDDDVLVMVQVTRIRQSTDEDRIKPVYFVADPKHVAAIEFESGFALDAFGLTAPPALAKPTSKPPV